MTTTSKATESEKSLTAALTREPKDRDSATQEHLRRLRSREARWERLRARY